VTPLGQLIAGRIAAQGPMRLDDYMALCLGHPEHGYYTGRDPLGGAGDFTTAPEISQMFGEIVGAWAAQVWLDQGRPHPVILAELGPGRGTLMRDALRAAVVLPGFREAARVWLVETSPALRARQAEALAGVEASWVARVDDLPEGPLIVLANEFFDALPVRQFQRADALWRERLVLLGREGLALAWSAPRPDAGLDARFEPVADGAVVEVSAAAEAVAATLAQRIAQRGLAALAVDYGAWDGIGDTLQAVADHAPTDPLEAPGAADLTTHVRFRALVEAAAAVRAYGPVPQGVFLERLGITARARALARGRPEATVAAIAAEHRRLTHPEDMGNLFQVLALAAPDAPQPPGFAR
jgi:SAM-dependent MidA family methyltransferase